MHFPPILFLLPTLADESGVLRLKMETGRFVAAPLAQKRSWQRVGDTAHGVRNRRQLSIYLTFHFLRLSHVVHLALWSSRDFALLWNRLAFLDCCFVGLPG